MSDVVNDRLRRVTDLFVEGTELPLGEDANGPIVVWVNKLSSLEIEECRRDALAARAMRTLELRDSEKPERRAMEFIVAAWSLEELIETRLNQDDQSRYIRVLDDLETDPEWREKRATMRRLPEVLEGLPSDDSRHEQLKEMRQQWAEAVLAESKKAADARKAELEQMEREVLEKDFFEAWVDSVSLDAYIVEQRVSQIYFAARDCRGRLVDGGAWTHSDCTHRRMLAKRAEARDLPDTLVEKLVAALEGETVNGREAGNSDAPASSSSSSEQPSEEEGSTPSIPEETSPALPTS